MIIAISAPPDASIYVYSLTKTIPLVAHLKITAPCIPIHAIFNPRVPNIVAVSGYKIARVYHVADRTLKATGIFHGTAPKFSKPSSFRIPSDMCTPDLYSIPAWISTSRCIIGTWSSSFVTLEQGEFSGESVVDDSIFQAATGSRKIEDDALDALDHREKVAKPMRRASSIGSKKAYNRLQQHEHSDASNLQITSVVSLPLDDGFVVGTASGTVCLYLTDSVTQEHSMVSSWNVWIKGKAVSGIVQPTFVTNYMPSTDAAAKYAGDTLPNLYGGIQCLYLTATRPITIIVLTSKQALLTTPLHLDNKEPEWTLLRPLPQQTINQFSAAAHSDRIASLSQDGTVRLWQTKPLESFVKLSRQLDMLPSTLFHFGTIRPTTISLHPCGHFLSMSWNNALWTFAITPTDLVPGTSIPGCNPAAIHYSSGGEYLAILLKNSTIHIRKPFRLDHLVFNTQGTRFIWGSHGRAAILDNTTLKMVNVSMNTVEWQYNTGEAKIGPLLIWKNRIVLTNQDEISLIGADGLVESRKEKSTDMLTCAVLVNDYAIFGIHRSLLIVIFVTILITLLGDSQMGIKVLSLASLQDNLHNFSVHSASVIKLCAINTDGLISVDHTGMLIKWQINDPVKGKVLPPAEEDMVGLS